MCIVLIALLTYIGTCFGAWHCGGECVCLWRLRMSMMYVYLLTYIGACFGMVTHVYDDVYYLLMYIHRCML